MLAAEIYGKVSVSHPAHDRMEDVLTSHVLSLFRYLDNHDVLTAFMRKAVNAAKERLDWAPAGYPWVYFWPNFHFPRTSYREPDAVIVADQEDGTRAALVVEVKYLSGLSNMPGGEDEGTWGDAEEMRFGPQLADEYCGLKCGKWWPEKLGEKLTSAKRWQLTYITGNYVLPADDIKQAAEAIQKRRITPKCPYCQPEKDLFWLSWRELAPLIAEHLEVSERRVYTRGERKLLQDVRKVLAIRNLLPFHPFQDLKAVELYKPFLRSSFWSPLLAPGRYKPFPGLIRFGVIYVN